VLSNKKVENLNPTTITKLYRKQMNHASTRQPGTVLYLSHGGGPLPLLGDPAHTHLIQVIKEITISLPMPDAILVISAHWEASKPTITSAAHPSLLYDYYGFPKEAYEIEYPASGAVALAGQVFDLLATAGMEAKLDDQRGFDHGLFVPLKLMYPAANIPCAQLSLINNLDPREHICIGSALTELKQQNVLVIGSGFSFHNLKAFFSAPTEAKKLLNENFENWLVDTCTNPKLSEEARKERLIHWDNAPGARFCHPREEHLLPLHVCYGLAGTGAKEVFRFKILGKMASAYVW
jgi:4,5-DOPA dioxygenase extradiol